MGEKVIVVITGLLASLAPTSFTFSIEQHKPQNASHVDSHEGKYTVPVYQPVNSHAQESLINQQSENVRHIIAAEQRSHEQREKQDEFKQVKKEKSIVSLEDERFPTLEELRLKCQHFSRLFGLSPSDNIFMENAANSDNVERLSSTVVPPRLTEIARRPVFIRNKPAFLQRNNEGFYVTATALGATNISTTKRPSWIVSSTSHPKVVYEYTSKLTTTTQAPSTTTRTTTPPPYISTMKTADITTTTTVRPKIRIKYTKFEPVILQKTILTDGRVMYHWHKSLPTAPVDILAPAAPLATPVMQHAPTYEYGPVPGQMPLPSHRYLGPADATTVEPSAPSSTTTEKSSWLFVPFSSLFGGSQEEETTTTESKTSTPSTTTAAPSENKPEQNINTQSNPPHSTTEGTKAAQLKVVVPVHYDNIDASLAPQNNNRQTEYYRKTVEDVAPSPHAVQVIKTLGVPQSMPRYTLGYTGTGYGLTFNSMPYGGSYGPEYMNYQAAVPLQRNIEQLEDVSV